MNRIQEYYETAIEYLSLPISARFLIGTHFKIVRDAHMVFQNRDQMDELVFTEVAKQNIFPAFKKFVNHYKKSRSHAYDLH